MGYDVDRWRWVAIRKKRTEGNNMLLLTDSEYKNTASGGCKGCGSINIDGGRGADK